MNQAFELRWFWDESGFSLRVKRRKDVKKNVREKGTKSLIILDNAS